MHNFKNEKIVTKCNHPRAWHDGDCCCNCIYQLKLFCHPWNEEFGKGDITKSCGYVCTVEFDDPELEVKNPRLIFFDFEHGYCELHTPFEYMERGEKTGLIE